MWDTWKDITEIPDKDTDLWGEKLAVYHLLIRYSWIFVNHHPENKWYAFTEFLRLTY